MGKTYLGDGVYCAADEGVLTLTTENGVSVQNAIVLEPEVIQRFFEFVAKAKHLKITICSSAAGFVEYKR